MSVLRRLGRPAMIELSTALRNRWLLPPFDTESVRRRVPKELTEAVQDELRTLLAEGMSPDHVARMLDLLAAERADAQAVADRVELVWSGVEVMPAESRDTAVVVQELFREAKESVLVASYALDKDDKARALFSLLAERMDQEPELSVRLFVNVQRKFDDNVTPGTVLLQRFSEHFRRRIWPGSRLPEVYHDPRALEITTHSRACLHAKCIVVDDHRALITSANFTEAAHERNIEAGTVITDPVLAKALKAQFQTLMDHNRLCPVPGL